MCPDAKGESEHFCLSTPANLTMKKIDSLGNEWMIPMNERMNVSHA